MMLCIMSVLGASGNRAKGLHPVKALEAISLDSLPEDISHTSISQLGTVGSLCL